MTVNSKHRKFQTWYLSGMSKSSGQLIRGHCSLAKTFFILAILVPALIQFTFISISVILAVLYRTVLPWNLLIATSWLLVMPIMAAYFFFAQAAIWRSAANDTAHWTVKLAATTLVSWMWLATIVWTGTAVILWRQR
jgi:hypothetical protein